MKKLYEQLLQILQIDKRERNLDRKSMADSEMRYRRLFESAKDGILILDPISAKIVDANPFMIKILEYPLENIIGKQLWEIGLFRNKEESKQAFDELKKKSYIRFDDMPLLQKNGKKVEVEFISNVYQVNNIDVIQCNIRDISERKQAEYALKESEQHLKEQNIEFIKLNTEYISLNKQLTESLSRIQRMNEDLTCAKNKAEESDRLKSAFLANISHEIRTPMNAIMGFADLLMEPELSKIQTDEFIQIITASSKQLLAVISDIIDTSKIEAGEIIINTEPVNIHNLLKEVYTTYKNQDYCKKIELIYDAKPEFYNIETKTDLNRVKQVLCNLLNNAIKFTEQGEVNFGFDLKENFIAFYIKDSGIGITPENQTIIFNRFRQVENVNTPPQLYGGNGLGLSISKALVEKLGGTLTVNSKLGKGSTFMFTIPYNPPHTNITINDKTSTETSSLLNWADKTILIVEDEISNHMYIEKILSYTGVNLLHAWDGEKAIEMVRTNLAISLVLMDIKIPITNGYDATRRIKNISPQLPIIAVTAYALNHQKAQALQAGFDNYISKPVAKDDLIELIATYLN